MSMNRAISVTSSLVKTLNSIKSLTGQTLNWNKTTYTIAFIFWDSMEKNNNNKQTRKLHKQRWHVGKHPAKTTNIFCCVSIKIDRISCSMTQTRVHTQSYRSDQFSTFCVKFASNCSFNHRLKVTQKYPKCEPSLLKLSPFEKQGQ
jgi:hypothetical protein